MVENDELDKVKKEEAEIKEEEKEIKKEEEKLELIEENDPSKHGLDATMWDTKSLQIYFMAIFHFFIYRNVSCGFWY